MYGTFTSAELRRRRREAVGDKDEFPWQMCCLFSVILAAYGVALSGCWDVAHRLDVLAERSGSVMNLSAHATGLVSTQMNRTLDEGDRAMVQGLGLLQQEAEQAQKASLQLQHTLEKLLNETVNATSASSEYAHMVSLLFAQAQRVEIMRKGLRFVAQPDEARTFVDSLASMLSVVSPVTDLLPGHKVAFASIRGGLERITDVQNEFAKLGRILESLDRAVDELNERSRDFSLNVHLLDAVSMAPSYEDAVAQKLGNLTDMATLASMSNFTTFAESEQMKTLLQMEGLVRDFGSLTQGEKEAVVQKAALVHEAAANLTSSVHKQAAEMLDEVLVLLRMMARQTQDDLFYLQAYAFSAGILGEDAVKDVANFYRWTAMLLVAVAIAMATIALFYACYLEYVYENEGIARAFETDPSERKGCCWNCVNCIGHFFHYTGFFALILLQDAVSLALVLMTMIMGTMSLAQVGVSAACDHVPLLSEDDLCTASMQRLGNFVSGDLLAPATSCSQAHVLICEDLITDMSVVYHTLLAALVGTVVSCCIPRRLLVIWMSAHHSIQTAEVLADLERNAKSMALQKESAEPA